MNRPRKTIALGTALMSLSALVFGSKSARSQPFEQPPREEAKASPAATKEVDAKEDALRAWAKELTPKIIELAGQKRGTAQFRMTAMNQAQIGNREEALAILRAAVRKELEDEARAKPGVNRIPPEAFAEGYLGYAHVQAIAGDQQAALETLRLALKVKFDTPPNLSRFSTLRRVAVEFINLKAIDDAMATVKEAKRQIDAIKDAETKRKLMPGLAGVHVAAGDVDGAFAIFERAEQDGNGFDINEYVGWFLSPFNFGDDSITKKVVDRLLPRVADFRSKEHGSRSLSLLAWNLARIGDFPKALELVRGIEPPEGDPKRDLYLADRSRGLNSIAKYQNRAGDVEGARKTFKEAHESAKLIKADTGGSGKELQLIQVAFEMIRANDFPGALRCIDEMKPGQRSSMHVEVGKFQVVAGDKGGSNATLLRAMKDTEATPPDLPGAAAKDDIQNARVQERRILQRCEILAAMGDVEEARALSDAFTGPRRNRLLSVIARAQAEVGDAESALAWIRKQPEANIPDLSIAVLEGMGYHAELLRTTKGLPSMFPTP